MNIRKMGAGLALALLGSACFVGCSDSETLTPSNNGGGGSEPSGSSTTSSHATSSHATSTSTTSSHATSTHASTGAGGEGGTGGAGGNAGGGGAGGGQAVTCLDASAYDDLFTIEDPSLCAVAVHEVDREFDFHYMFTLNWGTQHHGPLLAGYGTDAGDVDIIRLSVATDAPDATLSSATTTVHANVPANTLGAQAVDLGFLGWTEIVYTNFDLTGEFLFVEGSTIAQRYKVNSGFSATALADDATTGRFLYTGASKLGSDAPSMNGVYAADSCATTPVASLGSSDTGCTPTLYVGEWGTASGPTTADAAGNVFIFQSTPGDGTQQGRAFAHGEIKRGETPGEGTILFDLDGFGSPLAAMAPTSGHDGIVAFQPTDATTFTALDVVGRHYTDGAAITAVGASGPLLKLTTADTAVGLASDEDGNLWAAAPRGSKTAFVVLAHKP